MKYFLKKISGFLALIFTIFGCIIYINYSIDSYGVFNHSNDWHKQILEPNQNFIKTSYILNNPEKFNSFVFGSSRAGKLNSNKITNGRFYNMSYSMGLPYEWLETIQVFLENDIEIKKILIAIDDEQGKMPSHNLQPMRVSYRFLKDHPFIFAKYYLLQNPLGLYNRKTLSTIKPNTFYDIQNTGIAYPLDIDIWIENNVEEHIRNPRFVKPVIPSGDTTNENLEAIEKIISLCKKNEIDLKVIYGPFHKSRYDLAVKSNPTYFFNIKTKLAALTDFWDFSEPTYYISNNYFWYETSHYRIILGELLLNKAYGDSYKVCDSILIYDHVFGNYITKSIK